MKRIDWCATHDSQIVGLRCDIMLQYRQVCHVSFCRRVSMLLLEDNTTNSLVQDVLRRNKGKLMELMDHYEVSLDALLHDILDEGIEVWYEVTQ